MEQEAKSAKPRLLRIAVVTALVLFVGAQAVRTAVVSASATNRPWGARLWPGHPQVLANLLLDRVAEAAASGRPLDPSGTRLIGRLSRADPLSTVPFLVEGAVEEKAGNYSRSERLLLEARKRDPRAPAARLLLAQAFLRRGDTLAALEEMAILARFVPGSFGPLTKTLAAHARSPSGVRELKLLIGKRPDLEDPLLAALADDPSNTEAILALASILPRGEAALAKAPSWQPKLLNRLVAQGRFDLAKMVWLRVTGRALGPGIHNPNFAKSIAPQPFNWTLAQSGGGVADPVPKGLHVVHFGTDDMVLAEQTLVLAPGSYRLSMVVEGAASKPGQLAWRLRCLPKGDTVLTLAAARPSREGLLAGRFTVPGQGCDGQRLELLGMAQDFPADADVRFGGLNIARLEP